MRVMFTPQNCWFSPDLARPLQRMSPIVTRIVTERRPRPSATCSASRHELAPGTDYYPRNSPSAHDSPRPKRRDLGRSEPEFSQNLLCMFAETRRCGRGGEGFAV